VPVNGAVVGFPHRRPASPLPVALDPAQAAIAAAILGARLAIPIHAEGYEVDGIYQPVPDAAERFAAAAAARGVPVRILDPGETIEISAAGASAAA
jgi:L-ascorbate metabolism protein UlaG (beta-lactamase superfamily)